MTALYVLRWNVAPEQLELYTAWVNKRMPGLVTLKVTEMRVYRAASSPYRAVYTLAFADLSAWTTWYTRSDVQQVLTESVEYMLDRSADLWGPSLTFPDPLRPTDSQI